MNISRIALALCIALCLAWTDRAAGQGPAPQAPPEAIKLIGKAFCLIKDSITAQEVMANDPQLKITSVTARVGERVDQGTRLAGYKPMLETVIAEKAGLSRHKLSALEAQLDAASLALDKEMIRRDEMRQMAKKGIVAESDVRLVDQSIDIFQKKLTFLREIIAAEKARMATKEQTAREDMGVNVATGAFPDEFHITAPFAGYVLYVNPLVIPGAVFTRGAQDILFEVGVLDKMVVRAAAHEIQAVKLNVGDKARMVFYAYPERAYESTIARISQVTNTQYLQQPSFYELEIALDNPGLDIKDGMRCDVFLSPAPPTP